jgi:hypothetical protein
MPTSKKRLPTESPKKIQTEMTSFTGKRIDNKTSPARSYAQVTSGNRYEALSDPEYEDEEMEDIESNDSDTTPKQDNATISSSANKESLSNPLSKKAQRKLSKVTKNDAKKSSKSLQPRFISNATKATLERARKAKELLKQSLDEPQGDKDNTHDTLTQRVNVGEVQTSGDEDSEDSDDSELKEKTKEAPSNINLNNSSSENLEAVHIDKEAAKKIQSDNTNTTNNNISLEQPEVRNKINNPYLKSKKSQQHGILHARPQLQGNSKPVRHPGSVDKQINLKKGMIRPHIHRYTLRIKIIKSKSEEEEQILVQKTLQKFFDIVLQGDSKSIIPPFYELDRADNSIPDLSSTFNVMALDSYYSLKRYFSRLSQRSEEGYVWCSIILAQAIPFSSFMEKARYSLENQAFSLWPKASDHELATDAGWLLYSTRQQDEERIAELLSSLTNEKIGVKWKAIRTTDGTNRSKDKDDSSRIYALHLECAADRAQEVRQKLSKWYGSSSKIFPDGTKMRLVPPFNSILSSGNRQKYASLLARQAALNSRLGSGTTWEFSTNLMIDRLEPVSGISLRQLMMDIPSQVFPGTPLFHTIDKQWRSETGATFTFLPENDSEARSIIAGLIPFLKHTADPWYMKMFTTEAKYRHASSKWDQETRQVFSVEEYEIDEFLADDDEYNKTDEPTAERPIRDTNRDESYIQVQIPIVLDPEDSPKMYEDADSVSIFHQTEKASPCSVSPSKRFTPKIVSNPPSVQVSSISDSKPSAISYLDDGESVSKLSDTQLRLSSMEQDIKHLHSSFKHALEDLKAQSQEQASKQSLYDATLLEILSLLKNSSSLSTENTSNPPSSARDNQPEQLYPSGGSQGAAGTG